MTIDDIYEIRIRYADISDAVLEQWIEKARINYAKSVAIEEILTEVLARYGLALYGSESSSLWELYQEYLFVAQYREAPINYDSFVPPYDATLEEVLERLNVNYNAEIANGSYSEEEKARITELYGKMAEDIKRDYDKKASTRARRDSQK